MPIIGNNNNLLLMFFKKTRNNFSLQSPKTLHILPKAREGYPQTELGVPTCNSLNFSLSWN